MVNTFYYIKKRKKGSSDWKCVREDGNILVFDKYEPARNFSVAIGDYVCRIISSKYHPADKKSRIYRKKYQMAGG